MQLAKGHLRKISWGACIILTLCGLDKSKLNSNLCTQFLFFFKVIKDVCCTIISTCKKNSSKKSIKVPNYHDECKLHCVFEAVCDYH